MMTTANLQGIAENVLARAQRQGSVTPQEVQDELTHADVPEELWEEVLMLCRRSLRKRQGRYHYISADRRQSDQERQQQVVRRAVRAIIRRHRQARQVERRGQDRIDCIEPVRVLTDDGRERRLLSRDISTTGLRLISPRTLLGQKLRVVLGEGDEACSLVVRVLWTCAVGDDLFENGCMFLGAGEQK
jgi:hypothetical protein